MCQHLGGGIQEEARKRRLHALMSSSRRFAVQQFLHHELGVANAAGQLLAAAELLQQRQLVGAEVSLLVDVGHSTHQGTQDQLGVVLEGSNRDSFRVFAEGLR